MTQDKDIKENLEFLDRVLNYLVNGCTNYFSSFDDLYKFMYGRVLEVDNKVIVNGYFTTFLTSDINTVFNDFSISDTIQAEAQKLVEACYFLKQEKLIMLDNQFNIKITFQGIIKVSEGFITMHHKTLSDSARLASIADTQLTQNGQILIANQKIASLTRWIAVGAIVAVIYQVVQLLKLLFSCCLDNC